MTSRRECTARITSASRIGARRFSAPSRWRIRTTWCCSPERDTKLIRSVERPSTLSTRKKSSSRSWHLPDNHSFMTFWTLDRVADALQSVTRGNAPRGPHPFTRVWTDTRTIDKGDLFVALVGERFDAHEFLAQA